MNIDILKRTIGRKILSLIVLSTVSIVSFSQNTSEINDFQREPDSKQDSKSIDKVEKLIKDYLTEYLYDGESYTPVALESLDSMVIMIPIIDDKALDLAINNRDIATDYLELYRRSSGVESIAYLDSAKLYMNYSKKWLNLAKQDMNKNQSELAGWSVLHSFKATNAKKETKQLYLKFFFDKDITRILKVESADAQKK